MQNLNTYITKRYVHFIRCPGQPRAYTSINNYINVSNAINGSAEMVMQIYESNLPGTFQEQSGNIKLEFSKMNAPSKLPEAKV